MSTPTGVWLICGEPVTDEPGAGCSCGVNDPSRQMAMAALVRRRTEEQGDDEGFAR